MSEMWCRFYLVILTVQEERRKLQAENDKNSMYCEKALGECSEGGEPDDEPAAKEEGDSGIDANSQVRLICYIQEYVDAIFFLFYHLEVRFSTK